MDIVLIVLALILLIVGIVGSLLPGLPGPPFSWGGLVCVYACSFVPWNYYIVIISFVLMVVITVMDFIIPAKGAKRFGGSKYGIWGTNIGLIVGLISPIPLGVIIGPFLGAFIGELIHDQNDSKRALKAASGAFLGFLLSTFGKVAFGIILIIQSVYLAITNYF